MLFNLIDDLGEQNNLALEHPAIVARLVPHEENRSGDREYCPKSLAQKLKLSHLNIASAFLTACTNLSASSSVL